MSADHPIDEVTGSISDGEPVDWSLAESDTLDEAERASIETLRTIEQVAAGYRFLHRTPRPVTPPSGEAGQGSSTAPRQQWGDLTVLELVRAGASGEVWRAWDPWLQREVALKFLQVPVASGGGIHDSALLEEARALARVRHPGVVAVHGIAEHDGRVGMWMELLEGASLAAEIERRGPLPPLEVARIGLALCRALEAVEAAGLVHRDIKPANVVLEATGRVVLTDFGLGRRWELEDRGSRASGTPIFMSPGVLTGSPATPRSDIYALGVTLRWALTGHPPFQAKSFEELLVEAKRGPASPLVRERPDAPAPLVAVIDRAMEPNAEARYGGAVAMAADLERVLRGIQSRTSAPAVRTVAAVTAALLISLSVFLLSRSMIAPGPTESVTFSVLAPPNMWVDPDPTSAAISPDGRLLAFLAADSSLTTRIWVRPLSAPESRPLEGTEAAAGLYWAPDSRALAFFAGGKLKKVRVSGGPPEVLCAAPDGRGASWGKDGVIVFAPVPTGPLSRISAEGGAVSEIVKPDSSRHETALRWPAFLPDGKHFLYVSLPARNGSFEVYASSIRSGQRKLVLRSDAAPVVAGRDQLLLVRNGRLMAQRFDFGSLRPIGDPLSLGATTSSDVSVGEPLASASMNGVLTQQVATLANTKLVWLDRSGRRQGVLDVAEGRYENLAFSPDGRRLLTVRRTSPNSVDLWMIDRSSGLETRLTSKPQTRIGGRPSWSPDSRRVAFSSNREGPTNVYVKEVDQGAPEEPVYRSSEQFKEVDAWSPDGRFVLFEKADPVTGWDLWLLPIQGDRRPIPYLRSNFAEFGLAISPNGKWLAYWSDESGRPQVYVQTFPTPGEKHLVSSLTAAGAWWSRDGRELLLLGVDQTLWSVPVATHPRFEAGTPTRLFKSPTGVSGLPMVGLAPTADLRRFLASLASRDIASSTITVMVNWPSQVDRRHAP